MRKSIIAGNWKMFKDLSETADLINALKTQVPSLPSNVTVIVCPPFTSLGLAGNLVKGSALKLGAQNMSEHDEGAFTGEVSWKMVKATGAEYVILGHSERRQYFHETNELINQKAKKALSNGVLPILCVGETLQEREKGITELVVSTQVKGVLNGLTEKELGDTIIAYEPVWAIGTGKTATPQQAQEVHQHIRKIVSQMFNWALAEKVVIQYGGSVKPDNAAELLGQNDIDGALVGGACLKADSFSAIIKAAKK